MSKLIKITPEYVEEIRRDFEEILSSGKFPDGKVTFTKTIGTIDRKAKIIFTDIAWIKMQALIKEFDKEVAWHGIAKRGDDDTKDEYIISDILVYPQEVTGATVTTDQNEYQMWLMEQEDDVFHNIRFQGHSHVNMATTPSAVDTTLYDGILAQLDDTMFYIFMIWNKRGDKTIKIYDMMKNVLFETSDCSIEIAGFGSWIDDAKKLVKDRVSTPVATSYSGYTGSYIGKYSAVTDSKKNDNKPKAADSEKQEKEKTVGKRKGKRKAKDKNTKNLYNSFYSGWYDDDYWGY